MQGPDILARIAILYELQAATVEPLFRERGASWATFQLLSSLHHSPKGMVQADVARRLEITPATLTETIQLHVKKGLVEQVASTKDKRSKLVKLTPEGNQLLRKLVRDIARVEMKMVSGLSEQEASLLADLLDRMMDNLSPESSS